MSISLLTVDQVKKHLDITDFRTLTKDKLVEFVSSIPYMDRDVAIKIIEQFPEFNRYAQTLVSYYDNMIGVILKGNSANTIAVLDGYRCTLDILGSIASMDSTTPDDRRFFAEKIVEVSDKMACYELKTKSFSEQLVTRISWVIVGSLAFGAMVLGVNVYGKKVPTLS